MRGHIKQRAKGSWSIVLELGRDPATGKRRQQWTTFRGTKRDAERKLAELQHQMDTSSYLKPYRLRVAEFLQQWLRDYAWPNVAPRTAEGYEHIVHQHLIPALGAVPLAQFTPQDLQVYTVRSWPAAIMIIPKQYRNAKGGGDERNHTKTGQE